MSQINVRNLAVSDNTLIGVFSDVHVGIHDAPALHLMIECMEYEGVQVLLANGDIFDCGPVSPHPSKKKRAAFDHGALLEEAAGGRFLVNWMLTRPTAIMGEGNHEDWINDSIHRENLAGSLTVASALNIPRGIEVLKHGYQIRIGSLVVEHGDILLGRSSGGKHLARTILEKCPDQSTIVGHFHRADYAVRTAPGPDGILRSHAAIPLGHLSLSHAHTEYAGRYPAWQQSFGLVRVYLMDGKPRFTVHNVEIHRDRYNRPFFEYGGRIYR